MPIWFPRWAALVSPRAETGSEMTNDSMSFPRVLSNDCIAAATAVNRTSLMVAPCWWAVFANSYSRAWASASCRRGPVGR